METAMHHRKPTALLLAALMVLSLFGTLFANLAVRAADTPDAFHYAQLDETAKTVYDGIYAMYESGALKTGTEDYDLAADGRFSGEDLAAYAKNPSELSSAMDAARYAFYADHPEVFWVDFPKLSLRTTRGADGTFHAYIGSGRYPSYLVEGFKNETDVETAIAQFDERANTLVTGAKTLDEAEGENLQVEQIKYVHDELIRHVSYRLEDTCYDGDGDNSSNASFLGTPYGVLVKKQGVCEGYARAFKVIMDRLGIECILVQGIHQYDGDVAVAHMWNYVRIPGTDGGWYAVDATQDDPELFVLDTRDYNEYTQHFEDYGNDGFENRKYLLAGQLTMQARHFPNGTVDAAGGYAFTYPTLEDYDYGTKDVVTDMDGFSVKQRTVESEDGYKRTEFQVSYRGMDATTARGEGIYLLARYYDYGEGDLADSIVPVTGWCYLSDSYAFKEDGTSIYIEEGEVQYMEFAATNIKPRSGLEGLTYAGNDYGLIARTGKLRNEYQNGYIAPPFILRQTPTQTSIMYVRSQPYHVVVEYDETLAADGDIGCRIECESAIGAAVTGAEYTKIENITWDGDRTVEFDVTLSQMFADDNVIYRIYLTGLVGEKSRKAPNPVVYGASVWTECPSVQARKGSWSIFGKPTLLEGGDLSLDGWTMSNGKPVSEKLKDRLALVATKPTEKQETEMAGVLEETFPEESGRILASSTYNITLSLCKSMVINNGHKVKVRLGFPDGYGPNDEGVTFKAYHFRRDTDGGVSGVEEIDCVVTPYGLILTCDAFSPFMVAAVESDGTENTEPSVVVAAADGGHITGPNLEAGILKFANGRDETLTVTADEGYRIESVTVCGKEIEASGKSSMDITITNDMIKGNNTVQATFVANSVMAKEAERDEVPVGAGADPVSVSLPESLTVGRTSVLVPTVSGPSGTLVFQWYKDGEKLNGRTTKDLAFGNVSEKDAGSYELEVTVVADDGTVQAVARSNACAVAVGNLECGHGSTTTVAAVPSTCTVRGHGEYVVCDDCKLVVSGSDGELPLLPHKEAEVTDEKYLESEATCTEAARYRTSCSVCGKKLDGTFTDGDPNGHGITVVTGMRPATCMEEGYTGDRYCDECGEKVASGTVIPKKGHDLKKVEAKEPTHDAPGNPEYWVCSVCRQRFADEEGTEDIVTIDTVIPAVGHDYTYRYDGDGHWGECSCGDVKERAAHAFGDWAVTKDVTADSEGVRERTCSVCGYTQKEPIPVWPDEPPKETEPSKPSETEPDGTTPSKPSETEPEETAPSKPSETEPENQTGHEHVLIEVPAREATHETDGSRGYWACSGCGRCFADADGKDEIRPEDAVVPKTGHTYGDAYKSDADGHWKECSCGRAAEKEAHAFGGWTVTKEATETETGSRERTCSVCGYGETTEIRAIRKNADTGARTDAPAAQGKGPGTGDDGNTGFWIILFLLSGAASGAGLYWYRKNGKSDSE